MIEESKRQEPVITTKLLRLKVMWYEEMGTGIGKYLINRGNISGKVKDWDYPPYGLRSKT